MNRPIFSPRQVADSDNDRKRLQKLQTFSLAGRESHTVAGARVLRLHDMRHTHCVHCLRRWVLQGADLAAYLPVLKTYMGHYSFQDTAHYLRLTAELFPDITAKTERAFGDIIPVLRTGTVMKPTDFAKALSHYLGIYLPGQRNVSTNTIKSYRDTFKLLLTITSTTHRRIGGKIVPKRYRQTIGRWVFWTGLKSIGTTAYRHEINDWPASMGSIDTCILRIQPGCFNISKYCRYPAKRHLPQLCRI